MAVITWNADMSDAERQAAQRRWAKQRDALAREKFTNEEKARWAGIMHATWAGVADDVGYLMEQEGARLTAATVVEITLDARRCVTIGGMTEDEAEFLSAIYHQPRFQKWARGVMRGYAD